MDFERFGWAKDDYNGVLKVYDLLQRRTEHAEQLWSSINGQ
jgi:hypothetical protein